MTYWTIIWHSALLEIAGTILLRAAGRKTISQMSIPQIAGLITIGAILGSEVGGKGLGKSILAAGIFIAAIVVSEWMSVRWNQAEKSLKGMAVPVITDGKILVDNIKRLRIAVDDLEKRLKVAGVQRVADVKTGTMESNGELAIEYRPHAKPVTVGDLEKVLLNFFPERSPISYAAENSPLFAEVLEERHSAPIQTKLQ